MTSTEKVNLESRLQNLKESSQIPEENKETIIKFIDHCAAEGLGASQQCKYITSLKTILTKFAPPDFVLEGAEERELRKILAGINRSDYADSTKRSFKVTLKKFYKVMNGGRHPEKVQFFSTTQGKPTPVTRDDLYTQEERDKILSGFNNLRDKAFLLTLYESGARPGELLGCSISDVTFNEKGDFIFLEGLKGCPDRTNQLIEAGNLLREWIKRHPKGGDSQNPKDSSAPLWVKLEQNGCKNCGVSLQFHGERGCDNFERKEVERMSYDAYCQSFKRACKRAGVKKKNLKLKNFRHTRLTEVSQFMGAEQFTKFAGWVPGSDRAQVYVHLTNDDVNKAIREEYGLNQEKKKKFVRCKFCGEKNPAENLECRNCKRPLSLEKSQKLDELKRAVEIYDKLEREGGVKNLKKLEKLLKNAEKIDRLLKGDRREGN